MNPFEIDGKRLNEVFGDSLQALADHHTSHEARRIIRDFVMMELSSEIVILSVPRLVFEGRVYEPLTLRYFKGGRDETGR